MKKTPALIALLTLASLSLMSCSRNPMSPESNAPAQPGAVSMRGMSADDPDAPVLGSPGGTSSITVQANSAGVLHAGRWTLTIHKNSIQQDATITMTVTDPAAMEVAIEVIPASANLFQVPIELLADCSDYPGMNLDEESVYWWQDGWAQAPDNTVQWGSTTLKAKATVLRHARIDDRQILKANAVKN